MEQMTQEITGKDWFLSEFARFSGSQAAGDHSWMRELREGAIGRFEALGFPTQRWEDWRFTNVAALTKVPFHSASKAAECGGSIGVEGQGADLIRPYVFEGAESARVVFVNGHANTDLSTLDGLDEQVRIMRLPTALEREPEVVRRYLSLTAHYDTNPFTAINTALWEDGVFIQIPAEVVIEKPIHLLFITTGEIEPVAFHPRVLIVAGESSQAEVIESHVGLVDNVYFNNVVTEIVAGENAVIRHIKLQRESEAAFHVATIQASLARSCNLVSCSISIGAALARNDIGAVLGGEGIECHLNGLYLARGRQHVDHHTRLDHAQPHGSSRQLYKGILDESGSGVFTGRIKVHQDAQKTDAIQSNRSLLLSEAATINTQPQLEIFADDVRCTHGATVGQLDDEAIFYLRSRGIGLEPARGLLTYAFANEVIDTIKFGPLRERLERLIAARYQLHGQIRGRMEARA